MCDAHFMAIHSGVETFQVKDITKVYIFWEPSMSVQKFYANPSITKSRSLKTLGYIRMWSQLNEQIHEGHTHR